MGIKYGDELCTIVAIDQPLCSRAYGVAPCTAAVGTTGTQNCFNTRTTCQDPTNYLASTITLLFSEPQEGLEYLGYVIPSLDKVSITPAKINIGSMDSGLSPFGQREVASISFIDHQHSDFIVDPYRLTARSYIPNESGTFWGKWLARNPYHEGYALRVYDGVVGQQLSEMQVRHYYIDKISGPTKGAVTISAKDLFTKVEARKAKAPKASSGELNAAITAAAGSLTLKPTGIGSLEYPASGTVVIGEEAIVFTRSGDTLTLTTRGALNTVAADHAAADKVQLVLSYSGAAVNTILNDLFVNYAGIPSANIPATEWSAEVTRSLPNLYSANICEPTPVADLIGELEAQAGFSVWPDVSTNLIRLKAIVPGTAPTYTVDDDNWIIDESLGITRLPQLRVSQVWIYFGQVNPVKQLDETQNYRSRLIVGDLNAEDADQYGTPSIKEMFSRWIPQFGRTSATQAGDRILSIFRDPPFRATFSLYADRDGQLKLAEPFSLSVDEIQDATGTPTPTTHVPIKLFRDEDIIKVESQLLKFYTAPSATRDIYIDNDATDVNIKTAHDSLYAAAVSGDKVRVYIAAGVVVGSSTLAQAFDTGTGWATGVLIEVYNSGIISGLAGAGGKGADTWGDTVAGDGGSGGLGLKAQFGFKLYNGGTIQGGGGGGGGGGWDTYGAFAEERTAGGGGGGGAGRAGGSGGAGGVDNYKGHYPGSPGGPGSVSSAGSGGLGGASGDGGTGGTGGAPGQAGSAGQTKIGAGGAGGAAGAAISGVSYVTWIDANGDPSANHGTILGATS